MAPNLDLSQIQSTLNQAMSQLGSMNLSTGASGSSNFVNCVWDLAQDGQQAVNGKDEQRANAIAGIVQNLMGMILSLGTNENSKATKEVRQNDKSAAELEKKADTAAQNTQDKIEEIKANIASNTSSIKDAIEKIDKPVIVHFITPISISTKYNNKHGATK